MTNEEIIENNKLIAEFMEVKNVYEYIFKADKSVLGLYIGEEDGSIDYVEGINWLTYRDWNKLIEVIEKIETLDYGFKMCRKVVEVYIDSTKEVIIKTKESCRLESTYKAVVDFINYTKLKKANDKTNN